MNHTDNDDDSRFRVYLAGPMRGIPEFNYPLFHKVAADLRDMGWVVFNPAERDIEREGRDISKVVPSGSLEEAESQGFSLRFALGEDLEWICKHADGIALLPGWRESKGATAEYYTAVALGLTTMEVK